MFEYFLICFIIRYVIHCYFLFPQDKESVGNLVKLIDKTNGYIFSGIDTSAVELSKIAVRPVDWDYYRYPLISILCVYFV